MTPKNYNHLKYMYFVGYLVSNLIIVHLLKIKWYFYVLLHFLFFLIYKFIKTTVLVLL